MNKIISGPSIYKVQSHIKTVGVKNSSSPKKNVLTTLLRKITNSSINLKRELLVKFLPKNEAQNINNFTHRERVQVVDSKTVKEFMTQKLHELDLSGKGKEDPVYASQACDAILASVYSNKKDQYCKMLISKGIDTSAFLKEAGEVASDMGLAGKMHHDIFTPSGAGANPFLTAIFSSAQQKYMHMFLNKTQQDAFRKHAEKSILIEVGKICQDKGIVHPLDFGLMLEVVGRRHLFANG